MTDSVPDALPQAGPATGPGPRLAAARTGRGLDQAAAARLSGLPTHVVRGLEAEAWAELGAPVYVRGWLARYCRVLDVDAATALAEYKRAVPDEPPPLRLRGEAPSTAPRGHRSLRPLAYLFAFALLGYIGWRGFEELSTNLSGGNAGLAQPTNTRPLLPAPVTPVSPEAARTAAATVPAPVAPAPAPVRESGVVAGSRPVLPAATMTPPAGAAPLPVAAAPITSPAPAAPAAPSADGEARLELEANADSWAEVRDAGGKVLYHGTLRAGTSAKLAGQPPFRVSLGHAQAVKIRLDDSLVDAAVYVPKRGSVARFTLAREPG